MNYTVEVEFNPKTLRKIKVLPENVMYSIARQTLDLSAPIIPWKTGKMSRSSYAAGVRGGAGDWYIGSYTSYAKYVWNMPQSTNWTTDGTNNKWFVRGLQRHAKTIVDNAINMKWKDLM